MNIFKSKLKLKASILVAIIGFPLVVASPASAYNFHHMDTTFDDSEFQSYTAPSYKLIVIARDSVASIKSSSWQGARYEGDIVAYARTFIDRVPYVAYSANPEVGFDCSGFIQFLYKSSLDIDLPHSADKQAAMGKEIPASQAKAGDWVWWPNEHIGLYIGNGRMIDAPTEGKMVGEHALWGDPIYIRFNG